MIQPSPKRLERILSDVDGLVGRLSSTFRGIADFDRFFRGLEKTFEWVSSISGREFRLELTEGTSSDEAEPFSAPELTAPVDISGRPAGSVHLAPPGEKRRFGAEDLHLLGTLAEFTGVLFDVSGRIREGREFGDLLRLVYDQLPVGVVCFNAEGDCILCSARAKTLCAAAPWSNRDDAIGYLEKHGTQRPGQDPSKGQFMLPSSGGHVLVELRFLQPRPDVSYTIAILGDLKPYERELREALVREVYRCRWLARSLTLVVIQTQGDPTALLSKLPDLRCGMPAGAICDVLNGNSIAVVVPERESLEVLGDLRAIRSIAEEPAFNYGWSVLSASGDGPEDPVTEALACLRPAEELMGPRLLVYDGYGAVAEMIEMIVRERFHLDKVSDPKTAEKMLAEMPYDGLVTECGSDVDDGGARLLEAAVRLQPDLRTIVTTTGIDLRPGKPPVPEGARVVQKPFQIDRLLEALKDLR